MSPITNSLKLGAESIAMRSCVASHLARLTHISGALPSQLWLQTASIEVGGCTTTRVFFDAARLAGDAQQSGISISAAVSGPAQPQASSRRPDATQSTRAAEQAIGKIGTIYVNTTSNNTICTLVDMRGNPLGWSSAGSEGYKNARKQTTTAAQAVAEKIAAKSQEKGYYVVRVVMKGMGYGKQIAVSTLLKSGLQISELHEVTPTPHNGCRAPKKRRP